MERVGGTQQKYGRTLKEAGVDRGEMSSVSRQLERARV